MQQDANGLHTTQLDSDPELSEAELEIFTCDQIDHLLVTLPITARQQIVDAFRDPRYNTYNKAWSSMSTASNIAHTLRILKAEFPTKFLTHDLTAERVIAIVGNSVDVVYGGLELSDLLAFNSGAPIKHGTENLPKLSSHQTENLANAIGSFSLSS